MRCLSFISVPLFLISTCGATIFTVLPPTNYESVKTADRIVIARATEFIPHGGSLPKVRFEILDTLKGEVTGQQLLLKGYETVEHLSRPEDFADSRPLGNAFCNPLSYQRGALYLLILQLDRLGRWRLSCFGRANSAIHGWNDPWLQAVHLYLDISALSDSELERLRLRELRQLAQRGSDPETYPPALIKDIDEHLNRPHPQEFTESLMARLAKTEDGPLRGTILRQLAGRPEADDLFWDLFQRESDSSYSFTPTQLHFTERIQERPEWVSRIIETALSNEDAFYLAADILRLGAQSGQAGEILEFVRGLDAGWAALFCQFFAEHAYAPALEFYRTFPNEDFGNNFSLAACLASLGDPRPLHRSWRNIYRGKWSHEDMKVLAASPTPEAERMRKQLLQTGSIEQVVSLASATAKLDVLQQILEARLDQAVQEVVKSHLGFLCQFGPDDACLIYKEKFPAEDAPRR